jgi:hypothetical protein
MSSSTLRVLDPLSPFLCFCHANRETVRAANPTARFGDMGRLLSAIWRDMSESDKAIYSNPVVQLMARQMSDMIQERGDLRLLVDRAVARSRTNQVTPVHVVAPAPANDPELRRSSRLRNKRLGLNFWGCKIKN